MDPLYVDLYEVHLKLTQISNNKPKTKKTIIKIIKNKKLKINILNMLKSDLPLLRSPK
jgi:hypothetical protein